MRLTGKSISISKQALAKKSMTEFANIVINKAILVLSSTLQYHRIILYNFLSTTKVVGSPKCNQPLLSAGLGLIKVMDNVNIGVRQSPYFFSTYAYIEARNSDSIIMIGEGTFLNNNFCAIADHTSIKIGRRVMIGANVEIFDSDFHGLQTNQRNMSKPEWAKPVIIEDDVFIGSNVRVLKGVTIGTGAVIANSSVVTNSIPAGAIAGGVPARILKFLQG